MEFDIKDKKVEDCRLRAFDVYMNVRLGIFDQYDTDLFSMRQLYSRSTLDLEFRDSEGNFEDYDPEWLFLKAICYVDGLNYDFSKPESFPTQIVKINPQSDKVCDLEAQLASLFGIPKNELIILLRHEQGYNATVSAEYYNMDWRQQK